jgi:hypothetical protein
MSINVATRCDATDLRAGRVVASTERSIILADPENPAGGFTEAEYLEIGRRFDTEVFPLVSRTFGDPTDLDGNARVILFFTRAVNQLTPPGGVGVVAGFFWSGDLFPRVDSGRLTACSGSNVGEVLYLAVPDPAGTDGGAVPASAIRAAVVSTLGHELQHLINAGRRMHVNGAAGFEEKWLNEALSFMAEELLFQQASGLPSGVNLGVAAVSASERVEDAFSEFAVNNLGRYNLYLQSPPQGSVLGTDVLTTRGAAWAFLRYVADRSPTSDADLLFQLANSTSGGLNGLHAVIAEDPLDWMRDWAVAVAADDLGSGVDWRYRQPSWNFRELIAALRVDGRFPLRLLGLVPDEALTLQPGSAAYSYFGLAAGSAAMIEVETPSVPVGVTVRSAIVRLD